MVPDAFNDDRWDYYYFLSSRHIKEPLKRRLTVYFADEKVARYENQGVPTQADLEQIERDLKRAIAAQKKNQHTSIWKRMFGRDKPEEAASTETTPSDSKPDPSQPPNPVPAPAPAVPAPAGMPSGQQ
jgi:hypothetical protein